MHELQCLGQKVIVVSHLSPIRISSPFLFGFASEVKVRTQAPVLYWSHSIQKNCGNSTRQVRDGVLANVRIGQEDTEEDRGLACGIGSYAICNVRHLGSK